MSRPDRPPRRYVLDSPSTPRPSPAWVLATLAQAKRQGLHQNQREAIQRLLDSLALDDLPPPLLRSYGITPDSAVALLWVNGCRSVVAMLRREVNGWRTRLIYAWNDEPVAIEYPTHPAGETLGRMLGVVFPGVVTTEIDA